MCEHLVDLLDVNIKGVEGGTAEGSVDIFDVRIHLTEGWQQWRHPIREYFPGVDIAVLQGRPAKQALPSTDVVRDWATRVNSAIVAAGPPDPDDR